MIDVGGLPAWGGLAVSGAAEAGVIVVGLPYDGSAVYRRGAAEAPAALRRLSPVMPPVDERGCSLAGVAVHDAGDVELGPSVETGWEAAAARLAELPPGPFLTTLGGDHCAAIPALVTHARRHPDLAVVWVDAHPDLCEWSRGGRWTVGCALRRAIDLGGVDPSAIAVIGCRDFDLEEVQYARDHGVTLVPAAEVAADPGAAAGRVARVVDGRPVHVSFDIDVLDPAFAPGTEVPSAGGLSTREALGVLAAVLAAGRPVGLDVCEVAPPFDPQGITCLAALKVVFETWGRVGAGTR